MRKQTIKFVVVLSAFWALLFVIQPTVGAVQRGDDSPYRVEKFQMSPGCSLHVETSGGSIKTIGHNSNQMVVEVYVRSNRYSGDKLIVILKEDYSITITKTGNRVEAVAKRTAHSWSGGGISISFVAKVPKQTDCELLTSGGSLRLEGVDGRFQSLRTSGGSVTINNVHSDVDLRTSGGSIRIDNYSGDLDGRTSGGSIKVADAKGKVDVVTSGGSIRLTGHNGEVRAATSGGSISAELANLTGGLYLKTSGGNVRVTIPDGLGLDLDLRGSRVETKLVNFTGEAKRDRIMGSVNGGGIPVSLYTSGGSVILEYE